MRILLIGARGAGKSSVAPRLAERLGVPAIDTDTRIVERTGRSIAELFADGSFRAREREAVAEALRSDRGVVAVGGGAVLDPAFDATGWTVVWLDAAPAVLAGRVRDDPTERPSLTGAPAAEEMAAVLAGRRERYRALARLRIATDTLDIGGVVESILARLR